ncbi:MAG TPA: Holliday junction branch migration protein RuvA [Acholeplasmataceae bacterium]|nr:Holliday junction branch migration protein RuvA [Acholeplasmataceae bacterium]
MYAYIKGVIKMIFPTNVVIENQGIGYLIVTPNPYVYRLEEETTIHIHHYLREDQDTLFGFSSIQARDLFIDLISVSGIGPKSALSILAVGKPTEIIFAIESQDVKYLTKFPGIGPKSAQQIILDLKGKLDKIEDTSEFMAQDEVKEALMALGYSQTEFKKIQKHLDQNLTTEQMIKQALQLLMK